MVRRYVSIKDVAARAGVSFQTASKVLNGGNVRVAPGTAARIVAAAESLGYQPNTVARSLVQHSTATIGLVAGDITDGALARFVAAAERTARRHGNAFVVGNLGDREEDGAAVVRMLIERRVDGLIVAAPQLEGDPEVADTLRRYVPAVSLYHVPGGGVQLVGSNHREGARIATRHLIGLGHTSIGTITGPFRRQVVRSRLHGYEDALRDAGIEPDEDLTVESDWTPASAQAATRLLLMRNPGLTAVFVHSDAMAIGVLSALAAAGRRVPADIAVVSCDDMPFAQFLVPAITSLRVPFEETGEQSVELLLGSIAGQPPPERATRLPVELIVRDSCGAKAAAALLTAQHEKQEWKMKILRRGLPAFGAVALAIAALAACSSGSGSGSGSSGTVTLQFWVRSDIETIAKQMVSEFNSTHKNIKVDLTVTPDTYEVEKLGTAIASGNAPDVVALNDIDVPQFATEGQLENITTQVKALSYYKALSPGQLSLGTYQGALYGVPFDADLSVLDYNKTLFKDAGLNPNDPPTNWAQLISDSKKITALGHGDYGFDFQGDCSGCFTFTGLPFIWAAGGSIMPANGNHATLTTSPGVTDALNLYKTLWDDKVTPPADQGATGATWGAAFEAGKIGIEPFDAGLALGAQKDGVNVGIAPIPGPNGGESTFAGGDDLVVLKNTAHAAAAWTFATWALGAGPQTIIAANGYSPVRSDLVTPAFKSKYPLIAASLATLPYGNDPVSAKFESLTAPSSPWISMWETAIFRGNVTGAEQTAEQAFNSTLSG